MNNNVNYLVATNPDLYFVSCNNSMTLLRSAETEVHDGYLYNSYSKWFSGGIKYHKKLKIYKQEPIGGYYVKAQGIRCYMNSLVKEERNTKDEIL